MQGYRSILTTFLCFALSWYSITGHADDKQYKLDITSTNAVDALNQLATQSEYPLLFDYDRMKNVSASTLSGYYTLQQALDIILQGTGFTGSLINQEFISISTSSNSKISISPALTPQALEEILVTGSNIRRKTGFEGSAPVQVLNNVDIQRSGAFDLADVATLLTVNSGSTLSQETGGLIGTSQFNIRGLGFGSTLTLINGRRVNISAVSDSTGVLFFDSKQLPLAMVKRIDVQTDGASSIYGSDAVGGVVNIITRKGYEGLELSARYQGASNRALGLNLASGVKTDKATLNLYASAYTQTRNHRTDFDWLVERIHGNGDLTRSRLISTLGSPGSYRRASVVGVPSSNQSSATITEIGPRFADPDCLAANGVLVNGRCTYNFADQVAPIPEENRFQIFSELEYKISDGLKFFAEASFSKNAIQRTRGPSSFRNGLVDGGDIFVSAEHPFNFWVDDPNDPGNSLAYINPSDWDNTIHNAVDLVCECRPLGFEANGFNNNPPFNLDIDLNYVRGVIGLDWNVSDRWTVSANYIYSLSKRRARSENDWNAPAINSAVLDGTFNPFGTSRVTPQLISPKDGSSRAENSPEIISFIQNVQRDRGRSLQQVLDLSASGDILSLSQGNVIGAVGAQIRTVDHMTEPDALTAAGLGNNPNTSTGFSASQDVTALFGEIAIPVSEDIEIQLAVRHEDYSGPAGSTTDPKISARWDVSDKISLRGSWGTAFRGPSIPQVGRSASSAFIDDPVTPGIGSQSPLCGGIGQSNIAIVRTEGSDSLKPESSDNLNLSAVLRPFERLNMKIDYWRFNYTDLITADEGPQAIVENDCNDDGLPNDPRVTRTSDGQITIITSEFINTGSATTNGVDLAARYLFPDSPHGVFSLGATLSYVNKFDVKGADGRTFSGAGNRNFTNQFSSLPQVRANASLSWETGNHALNLGFRYIDDYKNDQNRDFTIESWTAIDLQYRVDLKLFERRDTSLTIGARNLFDADPPSLGQGQRPAYDDRVHDIRGRSIYVALKQDI